LDAKMGFNFQRVFENDREMERQLDDMSLRLSDGQSRISHEIGNLEEKIGGQFNQVYNGQGEIMKNQYITQNAISEGFEKAYENQETMIYHQRLIVHNQHRMADMMDQGFEEAAEQAREIQRRQNALAENQKAIQDANKIFF